MSAVKELNIMKDAEKNTVDLNTPIIDLRGIVKDYGFVRALDGVDFKVYPGEIIALCGDNGAGKSTLIKIISGVINQSDGDIFFKGEKSEKHDSKIALEKGIETIYQDMNLVDCMNIMRNIFLGRELCRNGSSLDIKEMEKKSMHLLENEVTIEGIKSPYQYVGKLSGGQKQAVSIARAMFFKSELLLLDEPTSALSVRETDAFLEHLLQLKKEGVAIVIVTHNLHHAYHIADRFVVIRHGNKVQDVLKEDTSVELLTKDIV